MKLWISGRIDHDIEDNLFRKVLNEVTLKVNEIIVDKNYGSEIEAWDVIMVIYKEATVSIFRYNARSKETDIEISIDHKSFKEGNVQRCKQLFFDALILSLEKLRKNPKLKGFNFQKVIEDVKGVAANNS